MILNWCAQILTGLVTGVLGLLPSWSPPDWNSFGASLGTSASGLSGVFPLTTIGACMGVLLGLRLFLFAWGAVVYVYRLIPLKAT